jgi:hypothetical protein
VIESRRRDEQGMWHIWGRGEERSIQGLVGKPEGKNHLEDLGIDGRIILKMFFRKVDCGV